MTTPVTPEQLEAARAEWRKELSGVREENARLTGQLEAMRAAPPPKPPEKPREFTRSELRALVDKGTLTEDQMLEALERQQETRIRDEVRQELTQSQVSAQQQQQLTTQLNRYRELKPELVDRNSDAFKKCAEEYKALQALGHPDATPIDQMRLEILAIRNVFGPAERIAEVTRETRETHSETSSGGGGGDKPTNGAPANLNNRLKAHYAKAIEKGMYSGWDDETLRKELAYVR